MSNNKRQKMQLPKSTSRSPSPASSERGDPSAQQQPSHPAPPPNTQPPPPQQQQQAQWMPPQQGQPPPYGQWPPQPQLQWPPQQQAQWPQGGPQRGPPQQNGQFQDSKPAIQMPPITQPDYRMLPQPGPYALSPYQQQPQYAPQPAPRQRTAIACRYCRRRKIRCSGFESSEDGRCTNCQRFQQACVFSPVAQQHQAFVPAHAAHRPGMPLYGAFGQPLPPQAYAQPAYLPPPEYAQFYGQPMQQHQQPQPEPSQQLSVRPQEAPPIASEKRAWDEKASAADPGPGTATAAPPAYTPQTSPATDPAQATRTAESTGATATTLTGNATAHALLPSLVGTETERGHASETAPVTASIESSDEPADDYPAPRSDKDQAPPRRDPL